MAKNIDFMGATFPDVPSIRLPQHEGGLVSFDDTSDGNIVASDVAQGKIGYARGQRVVGTATPSTPTIQSLSVTENGTYTAPSGVDGYSPVTVNVSGGGASNYIHGEFTTQRTVGAQTISILYTGSGYPIMAYICIKGGAYKGGTDWYNLIQKNAIGVWSMSKSDMSLTPTYNSSDVQNQSVVAYIYKNSTTSSTSYSRHSIMGADVYQATGATSVVAGLVRFAGNTTLSVYVNSSGSALVPETDYEYFIVYSS